MAFGDMNRIEPGTAQSLQHSIKLLRITRGQGFEREPEYVCRTLYDVRTVQQYMGHASINNTVIYTRLNAVRFNGLWKD